MIDEWYTDWLNGVSEEDKIRYLDYLFGTIEKLKTPTPRLLRFYNYVCLHPHTKNLNKLSELVSKEIKNQEWREMKEKGARYNPDTFEIEIPIEDFDGREVEE